MSRDINDIIKEVNKSNKEIHRVDSKLSKEISDLHKDINATQKEIKTIGSKIDYILDLLTSLTVFIEENGEEVDEDDLEEYESNEGWLPEVDNWEKNYEEDDDDAEDSSEEL